MLIWIFLVINITITVFLFLVTVGMLAKWQQFPELVIQTLLEGNHVDFIEFSKENLTIEQISLIKKADNGDEEALVIFLKQRALNFHDFGKLDVNQCLFLLNKAFNTANDSGRFKRDLDEEDFDNFSDIDPTKLN